MKTMGYKAKSTTLAKPRSRQRQRTEKEALSLLDEVRLTPARKRQAVERIRAARQPVAEARRIVEQAKRDELRGVERDEFDFSDVQELRTRLIRRDGGIWKPHTDLLARMDRMIALGDMSRAAFEHLGRTLLSMPQAIPARVRLATT